MNSSPWLIVMSFSPRTSRLPFGSRSATVTVMLPSKRLLWLESAWPSNVVSLDISLFKIGVPPDVIGRPANIGNPVSTLLPRAVDVLDSFEASVRSTSRIVRMSPTARARKSMNRSKLPAVL